MESSTSRARRLRRNMTVAERTLRRQRPIGEYFVDFACLYPRLIVEVDGGLHQWRTAQDLENYETGGRGVRCAALLEQ